MRFDRRAAGRVILMPAVALLYLLHQDVWNWEAARPLVFGLFPIGLFYHVCYCIAAAVLMAVIVKRSWPEHLEQSAAAPPGPRDAESRR